MNITALDQMFWRSDMKNPVHHIYQHDNTIYLDDQPLRGVRNVEIRMDIGDNATIAHIEMWCDPTMPTLAEVNNWTRDRMLREEEWKQMMTKKAQELLDGLT